MIGDFLAALLAIVLGVYGVLFLWLPFTAAQRPAGPVAVVVVAGAALVLAAFGVWHWR